MKNQDLHRISQHLANAPQASHPQVRTPASSPLSAALKRGLATLSEFGNRPLR